MFVIHGHWLLPLQPGDSGRFILWAETSDAKLRKPRGRPRFPSHAFALPPELLIKTLETLIPLPETTGGIHELEEEPEKGSFHRFSAVIWRIFRRQPAKKMPELTGIAVPPSDLHAPETASTPFTVILPAQGNLPLPSPRLVHDWDAFRGGATTGLRRFKLEGLALDPAGALYLLNLLPEPEALPPHLALGDDLRYWITVARFALEMLAAERYLPAIEHVDTRTFQARWRPLFDDPARLSRLLSAMPPAARACLPIELTGPEDDAAPAHRLLEDFLATVIDAAVREWHGPRRRPLPDDDVTVAWLNALFAADPTIIGPYFSLSTLNRAHKTWVRQLQAAGDADLRTTLRLGVPATPQEPWPLEFLLQARDDPSLLIEARTVWQTRGKTLLYLERRFDNPQERLLTALGYAARLFPPLEASLRQKRPTAAHLSAQEAYTFLREAAPLLEQSGFGLLVPPWWNKRGASLGARLKVKTETQPPIISSGLLSLDNLVNYNWEIVLGDQTLTREEFEALVKLKMPLMQVRGQWVALNPEEIEAAIRFWEKRQAESQMSVLEAMVWGLSGEGEADGLRVDDVAVSGWLGELLDRLQRGEVLDPVAQPDRLIGELRPYQERGFSWLAFMRRWGLGSCLADDMGLGKTIQTIALFLYERAGDGRVPPALVICPTSVAGNWQREIERFAPGLSVLIHHGAGRAAGQDFLEQAAGHDVVITSYGLARRDGDLLAEVLWSTLVLDEAQNIKNPAAKQTQAIRRLPAHFRLALTGTPVENRLLELWSIMHFLNPGYLGSQKRFRTELSLPIERYRDQEATRQLRQLVGPFILRRLKSDPSIIQDLPEKLEMKVYCNLTPEQATLYQVVVEDSLRQLDEMEAEDGTAGEPSQTDAMSRRGLVLSTLMKLKQICNHPAQFLGDQSELPGRSGKLARLTEMLEELLSVDDRALIFSQFSSMGEMLKGYLQETFGREVLFLHGGTPRKKREWMVDRFQATNGGSPPIFILSLKAGGVGLNLTAANHVFHFDRWWNPAVEQQATDRAYRIGQERNVQVHKFISAGTLEENIDQLIESKKALAESVIASGEGWLTELSTDDLRQILTLRK